MDPKFFRPRICFGPNNFLAQTNKEYLIEADVIVKLTSKSLDLKLRQDKCHGDIFRCINFQGES